MRAFVLVVSLAVAVPVEAAVKQASSSSIQVEHDLPSDAAPAAIYKALGQVGRWWSDTHTWSGHAAHLSLAPRAGGCFCEVWADGSAEHGRVIQTGRDRLLRLQATLG